MIVDPETGYTNIHHKQGLLQTVTPVKSGKHTPKKTLLFLTIPTIIHVIFRYAVFKPKRSMSLWQAFLELKPLYQVFPYLPFV